MTSEAAPSPSNARVRGILRRKRLRLRWVRLLNFLGYSRLLIGDSRHGVRPDDEARRARTKQMRVPDRGPICTVVGGLEIQMSLMETARDIRDYLEVRDAKHAGDPVANLERGERCLLARHEGRVIGCCWFVVGGSVWLEYLDYELPLAPNECYEGGLWVDRAYRGRNLLHSLSYACRRKAIQIAAESGLEKRELHFVFVVLPENEPSLRSIYRGGGRIHEKLVRLRIGSWQRVFRRPASWEPTADPR